MSINKVTYFDVEYANPKNKSICQIGLMCEDYSTGEPYLPEKDIFINPNDDFCEYCIYVHNITPQQVKNEPLFSDVWFDIEKYFTNTIVIGHNVAASDLKALEKNLNRYNIDIPELYYICTLELAKEYIPHYEVENYSLSSLCKYFDIDIDNEHNAFDDACANADLLKSLVKKYSIDINSKIKKYIPNKTTEFQKYVSSPILRKSINEFYGLLRGFSIDNQITDEEAAYIIKWKNEHMDWIAYNEIKEIITVIDEISKDGIITVEETFKLQKAVKHYLDIIKTAPVTLATQILDGILKGIIIDKEISVEESVNLKHWLYDNIYLTGHYPFDKIMDTLESVLEDSIVTQKESEYLTRFINDLLNPVELLSTQLYSIEGKSVCLSGNFEYGKKSDVEKIILEKGGIVDNSVKQTTDFLVVGASECQAFSNGTYGTKVKKAIELQEKGFGIQIVKEEDLFKNMS